MRILHTLPMQIKAQLQPSNSAKFFSVVHWISDTCVSLCFIMLLILGNVELRIRSGWGCDGRTRNKDFILLQTNKTLNIWTTAVLGLFVLWHSWGTVPDAFFKERSQDNLLGFVWNRCISSTSWQLLCCVMPCADTVKLAQAEMGASPSLFFFSCSKSKKRWEKGDQRSLAWESELLCLNFSIWKIEGKAFFLLCVPDWPWGRSSCWLWKWTVSPPLGPAGKFLSSSGHAMKAEIQIFLRLPIHPQMFPEYLSILDKRDENISAQFEVQS